MSTDHLSPEIKNKEPFQEYFKVSRETLERLVVFESILKKWQGTINLVSPGSLDNVWHRHFADSAQVLSLAPEDARNWVDLGSGAGFPGLVLAILRAGRGLESDQVAHVLIESDQRKAAFMREVARQTGVTVDIIVERIELSSTHDRISSVDIITARALAPMSRLIGLSADLFAKGGLGLFLKGRGVGDEVAFAKSEWRFDFRLVPSVTDPEGRIVVVENVETKAKSKR